MTRPRHLVLRDLPLPEQLRLARDLPPPGTCQSIRESAQLSREQFARAFLGVQGVTLRSWELGKRRPQFRHLVIWSLGIRELQKFLQEQSRDQSTNDLALART